MKFQLDTLDIVILIAELREKLLGSRVDQIYDIDKKNYLIRMSKNSIKHVLFLESGTRFHTTKYEYPKSSAPSGFTMKLRKHLSNKRIENITQVGALRVINLQFGIEAAAYHIIVELYDKGNIILTDSEYNILNVIRVHGQQGDGRIATHEKFDIENVKSTTSITFDEMKEKLEAGKGKHIRQVFLSSVEFGPALFSYVLKLEDLTLQTKIPNDIDSEFENRLFRVFENGRLILEKSKEDGSKVGGFIVNDKNCEFYEEFHPSIIVSNYEESRLVYFPSLDEAIDDFFSKIEAQKIEKKQKTQEREAYKKLDRVKIEQQKKLDELKNNQEIERKKAELIMFNQFIVDNAIKACRQMVASQINWEEIWERIQEAALQGDEVAGRITKIDLLKNQFSMKLNIAEEDEEDIVDINLDLSAYANASKYFDLKKANKRKEERTLESQDKIFKSTEKKAMAQLKEVATIQNIKKARKILWFEKFRWFISSENYLIIAGRDAQQNELLVKKHLKDKDVYLHADSHGCPSVIIKNQSGDIVPPKTLNEASCYAISYSASWETKVLSTCYWVFGNQVTKSAPTGEYLSTGSFMVRGKKNFLPPSQLVLGFGFLFKLSEQSVPGHKGERSRKNINDDDNMTTSAIANVKQQLQQQQQINEEKKVIQEIDEKVEKIQLENEPESTIINTMILPPLNYTSKNVKPKGQKQKQQQSKNSNVQQQIQQQQQEQKVENNVKEKVEKSAAGDMNEEKNPNPNAKKRGQHGRKKKLKEKYKDQDDEERELRMKLLQPAIAKEKELKEEEEKKLLEEAQRKAAAQENGENVEDSTAKTAQQKNKYQYQKLSKNDQNQDNIVDDEPEELEQEAMDILDTLTGCPFENDELLFAVPIVGPWPIFHSFKYKIKVIPGQGKRGKAAKQAYESFLRDKSATQHEKDLLKSVKDQDLARNFPPGKVKLGQLKK